MSIKKAIGTKEGFGKMKKADKLIDVIMLLSVVLFISSVLNVLLNEPDAHVSIIICFISMCIVYMIWSNERKDKKEIKLR